jgi:transcriptional regulator with XRE-family HTH domain
MKKNRSVLDEIRDLFPSTPEREVAREKERLRLKLAFNMAAARELAGISQQCVAEKMGKTQSWVSKIESPNHDHQIETILEYILALGGELSLGFKVGGAVFRILEFEPEVTYQLPVLTREISHQVAVTGDVGKTSSSAIIIAEELSTDYGYPAVAQSNS